MPSGLPMDVSLDQEEGGPFEFEESIKRPGLSSGVSQSEPPGFTVGVLKGEPFSGPSRVTEETDASERTSLMESNFTDDPNLQFGELANAVSVHVHDQVSGQESEVGCMDKPADNGVEKAN